jgi:hypothetical protein
MRRLGNDVAGSRRCPLLPKARGGNILINIYFSKGARSMIPRDSETRIASPKEWRQPVLRKLPISATSNGKVVPTGDDGNCVGKGDTVTCIS